MEPIKFVEFRGNGFAGGLTDVYLQAQDKIKRAVTAREQVVQAKGNLLPLPAEITEEWLADEANTEALLRLLNFRTATAQGAAQSKELYDAIVALGKMLKMACSFLDQELESDKTEEDSTWWEQDIDLLDYTACERLLEQAMKLEQELENFLSIEIKSAANHLSRVGHILRNNARKSRRYVRWLPKLPVQYNTTATRLLSSYLHALQFDGTSVGQTGGAIGLSEENEQAVLKTLTDARWSIKPSVWNTTTKTETRWYTVHPPED